MPAHSGQTYGPYRVIRPLGGGGMGTVLLAEDARLGRFVALKTFSGRAATAHAREQLLREARAVARLTHPNVAAVHDVLDIGGETVIVFEYVEGETLATRLSRGRLSVGEAIRIGIQLADGLAAAHAQGIVHRDLKPANVMLTPDGRAKVLDFGIAQSIALDNEETSPALSGPGGIYAGTPAYASPEQWLGEPVGPFTDIFALGLLLFEMLGGRLPFDSASRLRLMQQVIEAPRPHVRELNPHVPASVDALIDSALSREPARRPASAHDVAAILQSIERDVPGAHVAPPTDAWLNRWTVGAGVALLVLVAALVSPLRTPPPVATPATSVIAILPLDNATGSPDHDYLAAGVADSLTTSLASLGASGITVLSRAAVREVMNRESELSRIAKELGATFLVEGSVQASGERVRLSVNLVRPDRSVAWGDSVEGTVDGAFELQSRLAAALGRVLSVQMSAAARAKLAQQPTANREALASYWRGRALLERRDVKGNAEASLAAFDEAVRLDPNFAIAHAARGETLWAQYEASRDTTFAREAIAAGTTALRLDANSPEVRYSLAVSLAGTGRLEEATDELQRALALQPNFDDARLQLGRVLARQGRVDQAVAEFQKIIQRRPEFAGAYSAMGATLYEHGRYLEAAQVFERVCALQPDNVVAYQQVGVSYHAIGELTRALEWYEKALAIRPLAPAYSNVGAIHHERREYAKAVAAYKQAIALRPNARETHRNLGDAYSKMGLHKEALAAYRDAVRLARADVQVNPRDARLIASLAVYLQKAGEPNEARTRIEEAVSLTPADFEVLRRAAQVHALARRSDAALDALERAIGAGLSRESARKEDEFEHLRSLSRFQQLVRPASGGSSP